MSGGTAAVGALAGAAGRAATGPIPPLGFVADRLGVSLETVRSALAGGSSIDELARGHGISPDALRQTVATHVEDTRSRAGQPPIQPEVLAGTLDRAFSHRRGGRPAAPAAGTAYAAPDPDDGQVGTSAISIYA